MENKTQKNKVNKTRILIAVIGGALVLSLLFSGTLMHIVRNKTANNTVTIGDVKIDLYEPLWEDKDFIVPNQELPKNPQIKNTSVNDAIVYMTVQVPVRVTELAVDSNGRKSGSAKATEMFWFKDEADEASKHENNFDSRWMHLSTRDVGAALNDSARLYVFGYKTPLAGGQSTTPLFDKVQIKNFIEGKIPVGEKEQIKINAYAIQASDVLKSNTDITDRLTMVNLWSIYDTFINQAFNGEKPTVPAREG